MFKGGFIQVLGDYGYYTVSKTRRSVAAVTADAARGDTQIQVCGMGMGGQKGRGLGEAYAGRRGHFSPTWRQGTLQPNVAPCTYCG